jgi:transposase InsO family protein
MPCESLELPVLSERRRQVLPELKQRLLLQLLREDDPLDVAEAARIAVVTEHTIRNWMRKAGGRIGRPPYPDDVRWQVFEIVLRLWREMPERAGWRTVLAAAGGMLPTRLVQESLREIKGIYAARHARGRARRRTSVRATAANVLWHMDATHLGRTPDGAEAQAQAVRDAARPTVLAASVGGVTTAVDAVRLLLAAIEAAGVVPLVLATDNGAPYTSKLFTALLRALRVVHLRNVQHTPQHNARAERVFRDWKQDEDLGRGVVLPDLATAALRVRRACAAQERLAEVHARPMLLTLRYNPEERACFYKTVRRRVRRAVVGTKSARARRLAEREAIHAVLEELGLIERTRGGAPLAARETEIIS